MYDPNMTMEEYIKLEKEKAHRRCRVFNWETATYRKIRVNDDFYDLRYAETEFPAIALNDELSFEKHFLVNLRGQDMTPLPLREQRHPFLRYRGLEYTDADIADFKERLERIYSREIYHVQVVDFQRMPELIRDCFFARMVMEHHDEVGVVVFTSRAWGRLFDTRGPLVWELILEFLSMLRFREVLLDLDAPDTIQFQLGGARRRLSWRQFILALGLHTGEMESPGFARMMAHSIAGRSQAPEKVTVADLFYLRGLDVGSVNIPYLLARYLRRFAAGRKSGAHISGGLFVARLDEHFGLLTAEILQGLTIIALAHPVLDMAELRQPDAAAGAPEATEDAPVDDEGGQAVLAPVQVP
ncbi:hypothetical protein Tco_1021931 [Tanacetum coccineum]